MYVPKYFELHEFLPPSIYDQNKNLWFLFDERILKTADRLRELYGPLVINDWFWGGKYKESGLREFKTETGSKLSQHKFGRALDIKPIRFSASQLRDDILKNSNIKAFEYITCIEMDTPWLHVDCRNWDKAHNGIFKVYPL